jgi:hypothetical protein
MVWTGAIWLRIGISGGILKDDLRRNGKIFYKTFKS